MSDAASVTFYTLLSLVPAITAIVSLYALVADPSTISGQLRSASDLVPGGGMDIIRDQVSRLTHSSPGGLSFGLVAGLGTAIWSANAATKAMFGALNNVYGEQESRSFVRFTLMSLAFTVGGIVVLVGGGALVVLLPAVFKTMGLDGAFAVAMRVIRIPVMAALVVAALALLYRYGPSRTPPKWRWVTWGGSIATVGWIALSVGFSWYVANFGSYNKTYGSLGAIVGFMTWIWLSSTVLLVGAQINAELEAQTAVDSTVGASKPLGQRGARAADIVAP